MIREHFGEDPIEFISKSGLKLLVTIVNRGDSDKITKFLKERHLHFQFVCVAQGAIGSEIMDLLGFGSVDKTIVLCVAPGFRANPVLFELAEKFKLKKAGKGIVFTIPILGLSLPVLISVGQEFKEHLQGKMEKEVDKMSDKITHVAILVVVDQGNSHELIETARSAGATGGTVINARRAGAEDAVKFFGISVQEEKEVVVILAKRDMKSKIIKSISDSFGFNTPANGIIISLPVDNVVGVN